MKCTMTGNCCYSCDSLHKYSYIATVNVINIKCTITIRITSQENLRGALEKPRK